MPRLPKLVCSTRAPFVTASSEKIDFTSPARIGDLIIATACVTRVGRSSLDVAVELVADGMTSAERRLCTQGRFTLVAVKGPDTRLPLPARVSAGASQDNKLRMVDMIFPPQTNHYGTLYGGDALKMMGKAAFVAATRCSRAVIVMAASDRIDFRSPIKTGEMIELVPAISRTGRNAINVSVELWVENLLTGQLCHAATTDFTMVFGRRT